MHPMWSHNHHMPNLFVCYRGPEGHEWAHPLGSTHFGKDAGNARGVGRCLAREASGTAGGCCPFLGRPRPSLPSSAPGLRRRDPPPPFERELDELALRVVLQEPDVDQARYEALGVPPAGSAER